MTLLRASDVTVYAVGFLEHQPATSGRAEQRLRLTQMAEETGGEAVFPLSMKEIESAYDRVVAGIRAQYTPRVHVHQRGARRPLAPRRGEGGAAPTLARRATCGC